VTELTTTPGSLIHGPWSYRFAYLFTVPPTYSITLLLIGHLFGKGAYFRKVFLRMWSRLLPKTVVRFLEQKLLPSESKNQ
jgi:hypothetical protein